jgi:hypothetical protein
MLSLRPLITLSGGTAVKMGVAIAPTDSRKIERRVAQYERISYFCALNTENQYGNGQSLSNHRKAYADG